MKAWRRRLTEALCAWLEPRVAPWGAAIAREARHIEDDGAALWFVVDGVRGLFPRLLVDSPRGLGLVSGVASAMAGVGYLTLAGAPTKYVAVNLGALLIGLVGGALLRRLVPVWPSGASLALSMALLWTALAGAQVDGASRWVRIGGVMLQPSLIAVPVLVLSFARARSWASTFAVTFTACALAFQPDRAMAAALATTMACLAAVVRDRYAVLAAMVSSAGLSLAMARPDRLPAVPWVDQILFTSFEVSWGAGALVLGGALLLLLPALSRTERLEVRVVFVALWAVLIIAAALGNFPTPVVGYSGGAVLGYMLGLSLLRDPGDHALRVA